MPAWGLDTDRNGGGAVVGAALWATLAARRRKHLQDRFGPEYKRTVSKTGSRRKAEAELTGGRRREELDIRALSGEERARYHEEWQRIQSDFVDSPSDAVHGADHLIRDVM